LATAYRDLQELVEVSPHQHERYAQLYWLLAVEPRLDPQRTRVDWLYLGLERTGLHETLLRLYEIECQAQPAELRSERAQRLLKATAKPALLSQYVSQRWRAMARLLLWSELEADLAVVRTGPLPDDHRQWLPLLVILLDHAGWFNDPNARRLRKMVRREVATLEAHALREPHWFDRIDYGLALVQSWHTLDDVTAADRLLIELIRDSWYLTFEEVVLALEEWLMLVERQPWGWVLRMQKLQRSVPLVYAQLQGLSYEYSRRAESLDTPGQDLWQRAGTIVAWGKLGTKYTEEQAFHFCWRHFLEPYAIVHSFSQAYPEVTQEAYPEWLKFFAQDSACHLVLRYHRTLHRSTTNELTV
jgi:hypothetical protein